MQNEDAEMAAALALSAEEASKRVADVIFDESKRVSTRRVALSARGDHHFFTNAAVDGAVLQMKTLNQFHESFIKVAKEHTAAESMCGYVALANVCVVSDFLLNLQDKREFSQYCANADGHVVAVLSRNQVEQSVSMLTDQRRVFPYMERAIRSIQAKRLEFYTNAKASEKEMNHALRNWVANYEIGRYLQQIRDESDAAESATLYTNVHFLRYNQFPQLQAATADERPWILEEEKRFGGQCSGNKVSYNTATDSVYWVQSFDQKNNEQTGDGQRCGQHYSPEEFHRRWAQRKREADEQHKWEDPPGEKVKKRMAQEEGSKEAEVFYPHIVVLDHNGHYSMALAAYVEVETDGKDCKAPAPARGGKAFEYTLLQFETMDGSTLKAFIIPVCFDTFFQCAQDGLLSKDALPHGFVLPVNSSSASPGADPVACSECTYLNDAGSVRCDICMCPL